MGFSDREVSHGGNVRGAAIFAGILLLRGDVQKVGDVEPWRMVLFRYGRDLIHCSFGGEGEKLYLNHSNERMICVPTGGIDSFFLHFSPSFVLFRARYLLIKL